MGSTSSRGNENSSSGEFAKAEEEAKFKTGRGETEEADEMVDKETEGQNRVEVYVWLLLTGNT